MKKIGLLLTSSPEEGGSYQYNLYVLNALLALPKSDYQLELVAIHPYWEAFLQERGIPYKTAPYSAVWRWIWAFFRRVHVPMVWQRVLNRWFHPVARHMVASKRDIWICPSQDAWSYQVPVPTVVSIHDLMHRYETAFPEISAQYRSREYHYQHICRFAKGVLVDSDMGKQQVLESYLCDTQKLHVLPLSVPEYLWEDTFDTEAEVQYATLPNRYFFYPAQFWAHKNHLNLIEAMALLTETHPDIQLVLSGSVKNGYQAARDLCEARNLTQHVHFLGYVPDKYMRYLYKNAHAMVMASFCGPTNTPIPEAIALGCPVAVSNVYAMPVQAGKAGVTFDPHSPADIARVLGALWTDDALHQQLVQEAKALQPTLGSKPFFERIQKILASV
jgi:glycosyltransferase involved in cell wall biosynthesis